MKRTASASQKSEKTAQKRREIMESVLRQVPFDGWTEDAFIAGAKAAGLTRAEAAVILPDGIGAVIRLLGDAADGAMQARIEGERGFALMRVRDKVAFATRARLEFLTPHREAMKRLMVWYALPMNVATGVRRIYRTVDLIWTAAGDTSTDYNYYTKRLLLAAVMKATVLFWLNDETPDCAATWEFLDRRIAEVVRAGKAISLAKEWTPSEMVEMVKSQLKRG